MSHSLTDRLQKDRLVVVAVDLDRRHVRVRAEAEACTDLFCSERTVVVTDEGTLPDLSTLNAGDIVKIEDAAGGPERIVVVRRVWDELTSPEW